MGPPFSMSIFTGCFFLDFAAADSLAWNTFVKRLINVFNDSYFILQTIESHGLNFSTATEQASLIIYRNNYLIYKLLLISKTKYRNNYMCCSIARNSINCKVDQECETKPYILLY